MTDLEIDETINQLNELLETKEVTILDDYFQDIYLDKNRKEIFRIKSQRMFKSQEEANKILKKTLARIIAFEASPNDKAKCGEHIFHNL